MYTCRDGGVTLPVETRCRGFVRKFTQPFLKKIRGLSTGDGLERYVQGGKERNLLAVVQKEGLDLGKREEPKMCSWDERSKTSMSGSQLMTTKPLLQFTGVSNKNQRLPD